MKKSTNPIPDQIKEVFYCLYCKGVVSEAENREMEGICDCGVYLRHSKAQDILNHHKVNGLKLLIKLRKMQIRNYESLAWTKLKSRL